MKSKDLYNSISLELQKVYGQEEAQSMSGILLEEYFEIDRGSLFANSDVDDNSGQHGKLHEVIARLKNNEPIQYVLGKAHFYGRDFIVTPDVLIPRRETEELVHLICNDHLNFAGNILDIGAGSGCISITLSLELPEAKVSSLDISEAAIRVAQQNADHLKGKVNFLHLDILSDTGLSEKYDVIVSNPPYVMNQEKAQMNTNVLDHEPHLALFVMDNNPLIFYKKIIIKAKQSLNPKGMLYFEINEQFGEEVAETMRMEDFRSVQIIKDMQGKDRIVKGSI